MFLVVIGCCALTFLCVCFCDWFVLCCFCHATRYLAETYKSQLDENDTTADGKQTEYMEEIEQEAR